MFARTGRMSSQGHARAGAAPLFAWYNTIAMTVPRARPQPPPDQRVRLSPARAAELRDALAASEQDEGRALTEDELRRMAETGEWPAWCDSSD